MSPRFVANNRLDLLQNSTEFIPELESQIEGAAHSVFIETYILRDDAYGRRITDALARAAQRGLTVHLTIDGFGSGPFPPAARSTLAAAGVQLLIFRPELARFRLHRHRLRRLHRKLAVVDDRVAFVGGINLLDDTFGGKVRPQFDHAVKIEGPLVQAIAQSMVHVHRLVSWSQLRARPRPNWTVATSDSAGTARAAFLQRSNWRHRQEIERAYLRAIGKARREIVLANAYFLPGRRFRNALIHAAQRGVRVRLLLQGIPEYRLVQYATRALYADLLAAGIEIYEYQPAILHAKTAVVDGLWATVGSSNIDPTSLFLAREANVAVMEKGFATQLRTSLLHAIEHEAHAIRREDWVQASRLERFSQKIAYAGVRALAGWVGYGREMT